MEENRDFIHTSNSNRYVEDKQSRVYWGKKNP